MKRPGALQWLGYAFGGALSPEHSSWVLHDTTCATWVLRHLLRVLVMIAVPLAAVLLLVPTGIGLRVLTAFTVGACVLLLTGILSNEMTERRLMKAGYEWGTGEATRARRSTDAQRQANSRRRERIQSRRAKRRS